MNANSRDLRLKALAALARDAAIGGSTAYRYVHEGIDALADQTPDLHQEPAAAAGRGEECVLGRRHQTATVQKSRLGIFARGCQRDHRMTTRTGKGARP